MPCERFAHARREHAAAAERDHVVAVGALQQLADDLLLRRAERLLAVQLELVGDRMAEPLVQQRVAVDDALPERRGELDRDASTCQRP